MPEELGPPKGDTTPKRALAVSKSFWSQAAKRQRTSRKARARAWPAMRSRMFCAVSRCAALHCAARRHQVGLGAQDQAVLDYFEAVRRERGAGRRDVDDELGG